MLVSFGTLFRPGKGGYVCVYIDTRYWLLPLCQQLSLDAMHPAQWQSTETAALQQLRRHRKVRKYVSDTYNCCTAVCTVDGVVLRHVSLQAPTAVCFWLLKPLLLSTTCLGGLTRSLRSYIAPSHLGFGREQIFRRVFSTET